jgi:hypothetical protein
MIPLEPVDAIVELIEVWHHRLFWGESFTAAAFLIASQFSCERLNVCFVVVSGGEENIA